MIVLLNANKLIESYLRHLKKHKNDGFLAPYVAVVK